MCEEPSQLDACIRQWKEKGLKVSGSVCDVSSQADRGKLINEDSSLFCGELNILVSINISPCIEIKFNFFMTMMYLSSYFKKNNNQVMSVGY
jgi:Tropinone reductase 1